MANTRIKDLSNTATNVASDAFIAIDGSASGTEKISRDNLRQDTADALAAAPSTYNLAPLTSGSVDVDKGGTGSTTVAGAKTNLEIPTLGTAANEVPVNGMLGDLAFQSSAGVVVDDLTVDGQLTAAVGKPMPVNGPTMRFDGTSYVEFANNAAFSFTDGTDDTPFSVSAWVKLDGTSLFCPLGKWSSAREWLLYITTGNILTFNLRDASARDVIRPASSAFTGFQGSWNHITATYAGSGSNSSNAFSAAMNGVTLYINGKAIDSAATNNASYTGMAHNSDLLQIGRFVSNHSKGEIRDVKLFNKELSAAEVREVYRNGQLPESFADSTGGAEKASDGDMETSGTGSWTGTTTITKETADPYAGTQNLKSLGVAGGRVEQNMGLVTGKRYRASFRYRTGGTSFTPEVRLNGGTWDTIHTLTASATWSYATVDFVPDPATNPNGVFTFYQASGADATSYLELDEVSVVDVGSVLDARAENYNQSAGKLLDVSGNDFVGTQSGGVTLLTPRSHLSAGTLDLTNLPTSATGLSAGEVYNDSGTLKIV